jgi:NADH-quinone oxidoreductase subunit J
MVLFLFVIMLLDLKGDTSLRVGGPVLRVSAIAAGVILFVGLGMIVKAADSYGTPPPKDGVLVEKTTADGTTTRAPIQQDESQVKLIARQLFNDYLLPFEVTSALLLAAIVGAVVISRRGRAEA